jgi:hypothetical protein
MFPRLVRLPVLLGLTAALTAPFSIAHAASPALTIYSRDLGLVRETRTLDGAAGDTVRISDVPERIDFSSVRLVPEGGARVSHLAYRWDVASGDALIESAHGHRVKVRSRGDRVVEGTLVAADGGWLVVRSDDGAILTLARSAVEEVRLATPPASLSLRPTLEAVVEGARRGRTEAELSYLTGGLSWSAEHVVVRRGENTAVWSANVTIQNTTGRSFENAAVRLVAGEPRRDQPMPQPMMGRAVALDMAQEKSADLSEQTFSEYHLYTLDRPATLRDREEQSFTMITPHTIHVTPIYLYRGGDSRGVMSQMELVNSSSAGLGVPLPGGRVRIYEADPSGALQFTGETRIAHTPEGEKLTLEMGAAFDLAAERRELESHRISDREREYSVEIKLRNRKKTAVSIRVLENVGGDFEVTKKTHEFTRKDAGTIQFDVPVAAGKEVVVGYTVRVRY